MKKLFVSALAAAFILSAMPVVTSCSSDDPTPQEKPQPEPTPEPAPTPDPTPAEEGVDGAIKAYFTGILNGESVDMPDLSELAMDDATASHVWELYAQAVQAVETPLPSPIDLMTNYSTYTSSGTMPFSNGETMKYALAYKGSKPESGWPMFFNFHGSGEALAEFQATYQWSAYYKDAPALYFIPQSPKGGEGCRWYQPSRQKMWERMLRAVYTSGLADPNKIYFMGISEGAYGTQRMCGYFADYLAGVGPIAGGEPLYNFAPRNTANIFYCARTGELDTMYGRYRCTRKAKALWQKMAEEHPGYYEHYIDIMAGAGHSLYIENPQTYGYDGITAKLKEHTRDPYPKYVYWENYGLGNVNGEKYECREGFYNLRVLEGQNGKTDGNVRDAYEMTIDGNTITLDVYSVTVTPTEQVSEQGWTMHVDAERSAVAATSGKIRIYLNSELVDMSAPVTVIVNGQTAFEGEVAPSAETMIESTALFFDPARVFPASVDVEVK